jgi:hypothetical protein
MATAVKRIRQGSWLIRGYVALCVLTLAGAALRPSYWLWAVTRPYESSDLADVSWEPGGEPGVVTFTIVDALGRPMPGVSADTNSFSGWTGRLAVTDANGMARISPGESEVIGLRVRGVEVMNRDDLDSYIMGLTPSVGRGLRVKVRVKDPSRLGITDNANAPP